MKVLMPVANILLDVDFNNTEMLNDAAKIAFNRAKTAYEDHFSGGETYIDDDDYPGDSILWGRKNRKSSFVLFLIGTRIFGRTSKKL